MDIIILVILVVLVVLILYLISSIQKVNIDSSVGNDSSVNFGKLEVNCQNIENVLRKLSDINVSNDVILKSVNNQLSDMSKIMVNKKYRGNFILVNLL